MTCCRLLKSSEEPAEIELTFTMRLEILSSRSEVSRKGAITFTAQVSSYPSSDFCNMKDAAFQATVTLQCRA